MSGGCLGCGGVGRSAADLVVGIGPSAHVDQLLAGPPSEVFVLRR
jgi:hypothetical protein